MIMRDTVQYINNMVYCPKVLSFKKWIWVKTSSLPQWISVLLATGGGSHPWQDQHVENNSSLLDTKWTRPNELYSCCSQLKNINQDSMWAVCKQNWSHSWEIAEGPLAPSLDEFKGLSKKTQLIYTHVCCESRRLFQGRSGWKTWYGKLWKIMSWNL